MELKKSKGQIVTIQQKRAALLSLYPGSKKIATMPDAQIHTVYMRLMNSGRFSSAGTTNQTKSGVN
jgi:hypothetical protein